MDWIDADTVLPWLAAHLGRHALGWYAALMVVSLGLAALGTRWLERHELPAWASFRGRAVLPSVLVLNLLIGFAIIVGASAGFAELAEALLEDRNQLGAFDDALGRALAAHVPSAALSVFAIVTRFGDVAVLTVIGVAVALGLLLARRTALAVFWTLSLAGNGILIRVLKSVFERVRPEHERALVDADGWSFPSGHTSGSLVVYGLLAWLIWRLAPKAWRMPAVLVATGLAVSIGCSRVFLQVHHASDVLAGWASGGAWLLVSIVSAELARHAVTRRRARGMAAG